MKKDTAHLWIIRQRNETIRKEKNKALCEAKLTALQQCENWLFSLTWAQMRAPVQKKREAIATEGLPLITKEKEAPTSLTAEEINRLKELAASDEIYELFENKITPTARSAEWDVEQRQREQARRAALRQKE